MMQQSATNEGSNRHRAEDDLFHFDRAMIPRSTGCDTGLFKAKLSARTWVTGLRPRWLRESPQPLVRPRTET